MLVYLLSAMDVSVVTFVVFSVCVKNVILMYADNENTLTVQHRYGDKMKKVL